MVVVLPVGPDANMHHVTDTIESILYYCRCNLKMIITDDSQQNTGALLKKMYPHVDILINKKRGGLNGGLYITLGKAFKHAVENYRFKTLLRIDTDALVIGENPQADAEALFNNYPNIGIAGLYKYGNEIIDFNNNVFDNRWPRNYMFDVTCTWRVIKRPVANTTLKKYFRLAFANGYELGQNIFGGAYFLNEAFLISLANAGMLPVYGLKNSRMEEDHLYSLFAKVAGFEMGDMASGNLPFGVFWKRLPASPETLLDREKKIIHSTHAWEEMNEDQIREYFKDRRTGHTTRVSA